jgi:hypothetical protein
MLDQIQQNKTKYPHDSMHACYYVSHMKMKFFSVCLVSKLVQVVYCWHKEFCQCTCVTVTVHILTCMHANMYLAHDGIDIVGATVVIYILTCMHANMDSLVIALIFSLHWKTK